MRQEHCTGSLGDARYRFEKVAPLAQFGLGLRSHQVYRLDAPRWVRASRLLAGWTLSRQVKRHRALLDTLGLRLTAVLHRRRVEASLTQTDRALRTARQCGQLLIHAQQEDQLMQDICRLAVEVGGYRMAWVGIAQDDEARSVLPVASHGFNDNYLETAHISWGDGPQGRGTTGTAIRERRTVVFVTHSISEAVYLSTKIVVMSPRPGRIVKVIDSPLPDERHLGLRDTPAFMELAHEVREALADGHH